VAYEDRDVINNPSIYAEMVQKSGQSLSPCVEVNGHMLADVSGDEVEAYLLKAGVVQPTAASADQPRLRRRSPSVVPDSAAFDLEGQRIALFNVEGTYYAIGDSCTHRGGPLSEGEVQGTKVTCPWHGADFDLKTGAVLGPPAQKGVPSYKVVVESDDIKVEV